MMLETGCTLKDPIINDNTHKVIRSNRVDEKANN